MADKSDANKAEAQGGKAGKPTGARAGGKVGAPEAAEADPLREHLSTIALVVVIVACLALVIVFQNRKQRDFNTAAWTNLAQLTDKSPTATDGFAELAQKYRESEADPFIRIAWASRLYEKGGRADVEEALKLYQQVEDENKDNPFLHERVQAQIERIQAELKDARAQLTAAPSADAPSTGDDHLDLEAPFAPAPTTETPKTTTEAPPATTSTEAPKAATEAPPATTSTEAPKAATETQPATSTEAPKAASETQPAASTEAPKTPEAPDGH
jgi:hypothetical protein